MVCRVHTSVAPYIYVYDTPIQATAGVPNELFQIESFIETENQSLIIIIMISYMYADRYVERRCNYPFCQIVLFDEVILYSNDTRPRTQYINLYYNIMESCSLCYSYVLLCESL